MQLEMEKEKAVKKNSLEIAKKYFEGLAEYYKGQDIKISFKERINKTQLAALLKHEEI